MTRDELIEELKKLPNNDRVIIIILDPKAGRKFEAKIDRVDAFPIPVIRCLAG